MLSPEEKLGQGTPCRLTNARDVVGSSLLQHWAAGQELEALWVGSILGLDKHRPGGLTADCGAQQQPAVQIISPGDKGKGDVYWSVKTSPRELTPPGDHSQSPQRRGHIIILFFSSLKFTQWTKCWKKIEFYSKSLDLIQFEINKTTRRNLN